MSDEPRKSFGFLNRIADFERGPERIWIMEPFRFPEPIRDTEKSRPGSPRKNDQAPGDGSHPPATADSLEAFLERQKQRVAKRQNDNIRRRYAAFDPWKGENT